MLIYHIGTFVFEICKFHSVAICIILYVAAVLHYVTLSICSLRQQARLRHWHAARH